MSKTSSLTMEHRKMLRDSTISDDTIAARGYYTETVKAELGRLGFGYSQRGVPALVIPIWGFEGRTSLHVIRPDRPRVRKGKPIKYEVPSGSRLLMDIPPPIRDKVRSASEPLFITEGVKKADAAASKEIACIGLLGVHCWKNQDALWKRIPLKHRKVYIAFDSDMKTNTHVARAAAGLFAFLESMGSTPYVIHLPSDDGNKVGLDDFFAKGGTKDSLINLAEAAAPDFGKEQQSTITAEFEATPDGFIRIHETERGTRTRLLSNFTARIETETTFSSGDTLFRELAIVASLRGATHLVTVLAQDFDRMLWVTPLLGAEAIVMPGNGVRDEVRAAIQLLSTEIKQFRGVQRLGWTRENGEFVYVHGGGVIRPSAAPKANFNAENRPADNPLPDSSLSTSDGGGPILKQQSRPEEVSVRTPSSLKRYSLPVPSDGEALIRDIRSSLNLLKLAPFRLSVPIYSGIWFAALADADFSLHLYGGTGNFKTEYAALATQHFGPGLNARNLPGNWSSTPNYTRAISSYAKNVVLPVDDFVPHGSQMDIDRSYRNAEDVFRSSGNAAGRGRCNRDGTPREPEPPKCLILSTGEIRPAGHSLNARVITLEVHPGDIFDRSDEEKMAAFTAAQKTAASGAYARAMAAYLKYSAADYLKERQSLYDQAEQFRDIFAESSKHPRTADILGKLLAGLDSFLYFARDVNAISEANHEVIWRGAHDALRDVVEEQNREQSSEDPVDSFLDLLRTAFATGRAHLILMSSPDDEDRAFMGNPVFFGYDEKTVRNPLGSGGGEGSDNHPDEEWKSVLVPKGERIGWKRFDDIFLEPKASLAVVQRLAKDMNQHPIPLNHKALGKRLMERGLLASNKKDRNVARVNIQGRKVDVFHIRVGDFIDLHDFGHDAVFEFQEEKLKAHEDSLRREQLANQVGQARLRKANIHFQESLMKLLEPW